MPTAAKKPCKVAGCAKLTDKRFCDEHKKLLDREYNRKRRSSPDTNDAFYSSKKWRMARGMQLRKFPLCLDCKDMGIMEPAIVVDHVIPMSKGGAKLNSENLRSLCKPCHDAKTTKERFGKA